MGHPLFPFLQIKISLQYLISNLKIYNPKKIKISNHVGTFDFYAKNIQTQNFLAHKNQEQCCQSLCHNRTNFLPIIRSAMLDNFNCTLLKKDVNLKLKSGFFILVGSCL